MLDNWTSDELFDYFFKYSMDETAAEHGRLAITDDPEIEKLWDQYVQSRQALRLKYYKYFNLKVGVE